MGPDWKTCSQCGLMMPPPAPAACPGCGEALVAAEAPAAEPLWFYAENKKKKGPVTLSQLADLLARRVVGPTTLVRRAEDEKWRRIADIVELRRARPAETPIKYAGTFVARHKRRPLELYAALMAVVVITLGYVLVAWSGAPRPGGFLGHSLGVVGFVLMLCAETLYSLRKRAKTFRKGRTSAWLQVHVFMGIVGPYLVLLHSAGRFHGLAGIVTLLTLLVVLSGFVGRYIYTAVPRTHDGAELAVRELEEELTRDAAELRKLGLDRLDRKDLAVASARPPEGWTLVFNRPWLAARQRRRIRRVLRPMRAIDAEQAERVENLLMDRYRLLIMVQSLPVTRRMMAIWHVVHVPLGVVMFTLAFFHVVGALYFSTFMR